MLAYMQVGVSGLLAPIGFLVFLVTMDAVRPLARMTHVDHALHDDELRKFGVDPGVLPRSVSVFRIHSIGRKGGRVPDLSFLNESAHRHRASVVVLMLADDVTLTENTIAGLLASLKALRARRRELVLCTSSPRLFMSLRDGPFGDELGEANLCSDPEFAVARAVELAGYRESRV